jgi:hypothetical protein
MPPHNHTHPTPTSLVPADHATLAPGNQAMPNLTTGPTAPPPPTQTEHAHPPTLPLILGGLPRGERSFAVRSS